MRHAPVRRHGSVTEVLAEVLAGERRSIFGVGRDCKHGLHAKWVEDLVDAAAPAEFRAGHRRWDFG